MNEKYEKIFGGLLDIQDLDGFQEIAGYIRFLRKKRFQDTRDVETIDWENRIENKKVQCGEATTPSSNIG